MADRVDMSLDDIIKKDRITGRPPGARGRGRGGPRVGGGRGRGGNQGNLRRAQGGRVERSSPRGRNTRSAPYARPNNAGGQWKHDLYANKGPVSGRLMITNLDYGVSDNDLNELFSEFGVVHKAAVHYDKSGRSLGTAEVIFEVRNDAMRALKQYNGVPLDGRPMKIQLVTPPGQTGEQSSVQRSPVGGRVGAQNRTGGGNRNQSGGGGGGRGRGGSGPSRGGRGGGRGRGAGGAGRAAGGSPTKKPTAEELDADLDTYLAKMDTD